jgi:uncharacterized protein (DUF1015 family)
MCGFPIGQQYANPSIQFEKSIDTCKEQVDTGLFDVAFILNPISVQEVNNVCLSGHTLPPKTTFFYPKVVTGFLFSSLKQEEFHDEFES